MNILKLENNEEQELLLFEKAGVKVFLLEAGTLILQKEDGEHFQRSLTEHPREGPLISVYELDLKNKGTRADYMRVPSDAAAKIRAVRVAYDRKNICLVERGTSASTGMTYYSLSERISAEEWQKVKQFFSNFTEDDDDSDSLFSDERIVGWVTAQPIEVEKILGVLSENTVFTRVEQAKKAKVEREQKKKERESLVSDIKETFKDAEKPDPRVEQPDRASIYKPGYEKMYVKGERHENPLRRPDIYGTGEWFVIQEKYIWMIENNGMDGDDWSLNNVETGGAGAIGVRVTFTLELAEKIRQLEK